LLKNPREELDNALVQQHHVCFAVPFSHLNANLPQHEQVSEAKTLRKQNRQSTADSMRAKYGNGHGNGNGIPTTSPPASPA